MHHKQKTPQSISSYERMGRSGVNDIYSKVKEDEETTLSMQTGEKKDKLRSYGTVNYYFDQIQSEIKSKGKRNKTAISPPIEQIDCLKPISENDLRDYRSHSPSSSGLISINRC